MSNFLKIEDIETIVKSIEEESVFFKNKKIAISGAFGFIGKYILESLLLIKQNKNFNISIYAIDNFIKLYAAECAQYAASLFEDFLSALFALSMSVVSSMSVDLIYCFII